MTTSKDRTVRLWDPATAAAGLVIPGDGQRQLTAWSSFSPDGRFAAYTGKSFTRLLNVQTGRLLQQLPVRANSHPVFSPDGSLVMISADTGMVYIWDVRTGRTVSKLPGHSNGASHVAFTPDSALVTTSDGSAAGVWETRTGKLLFRPSLVRQGNRPKPEVSPVGGMAFTPDGRLAITAHNEFLRSPLRVWEPRTGRLLFTLKGGKPSVSRLVVSPNGRLAVMADGENTLYVWDVMDRRTVAVSTVPGGELRDVIFSADGASVITWSEDKKRRTEVRLWDTATWKSVIAGVVDGHIFQSNGKFALLFGRVIEISTGLTVLTLPNSPDPGLPVLSPDGSRVLTVDLDAAARIYTCELCVDAAELYDLAMHRLQLTGRTLTADDRRRYLPGLPQ
jgi:WD40 repeat protein